MPAITDWQRFFDATNCPLLRQHAFTTGVAPVQVNLEKRRKTESDPYHLLSFSCPFFCVQRAEPPLANYSCCCKPPLAKSQHHQQPPETKSCQHCLIWAEILEEKERASDLASGHLAASRSCYRLQANPTPTRPNLGFLFAKEEGTRKRKIKKMKERNE